MAKQTVNLGTSANKGDGDPLRTAFDKINDNFNELYAGNFADPASISSSIIPSVTNTYDLGSSTKRWSDLHVNDFIYLNGSRLEVTAGGALLIGGSPPSEVQDTIGSVFGDDSTLLVDGVNNVIPKANIEDSANWDTAFGWGNHTAGGYAPQTTTYTKTEVDSAISAVNTLDGDFTGSVFGDDSTVLVDGVNNKIVGTVDTASLTVSSTNVAIGNSAGLTGQNGFAVAIGTSAGLTNQSTKAVAVGDSAGATTQGEYSVAVGNLAGQTTQGGYSVSVGYLAGATTQGIRATSIGTGAGTTNQGADATALGRSSANINQGTQATALGGRAGYHYQSASAVAIGYNAAEGESIGTAYVSGGTGGAALVVDDTTGIYPGYRIVGTGFTTQTVSAVNDGTTLIIDADASETPSGTINFVGAQGVKGIAIGYQTGQINQGAGSVAIGDEAGKTTQSDVAVAIGSNAGLTNQGSESVAIGRLAGKLNQGAQTIAIGPEAGRDDQGANGIALGHESGRADQAEFGIAIGEKAGHSNQGIRGIGIGRSSGKTDQGTKAVAIGDAAGYATQGANAIAIGEKAGETTQGTGGIAIGYQAGQTNQDTGTVAIGTTAGTTTQGEDAVAVGTNAGKTTQGTDAVAIGHSAGETSQGAGAIAIGYNAGSTNQAANSIVINAGGLALENTQEDSLKIVPIRSATMTTILGYNAATGEVTHNAAIPGYTNTADLKALVAASADFADYQTRIAAL